MHLFTHSIFADGKAEDLRTQTWSRLPWWNPAVLCVGCVSLSKLICLSEFQFLYL